MYEADIGNSERFRWGGQNVKRWVLEEIERDLSRRRDLYTDLFCVEKWNGIGAARGHWESSGTLRHL
jgi:hypothetical protein